MMKTSYSFGDLLAIFFALVIVVAFGYGLLRLFLIGLRRYREGRRPISLFKKPTLFYVRELLMHGEKEAAVKVYRKIFNSTPEEALRAVEDIEKNLHNNA